MKRSAGVTVIAVLSLIGSGLTLLMGIFMVVTFALAPQIGAQTPSVPPAFFKMMILFSGIFYGGLAGWGISTAIGLLRLRNWARLSIIVFSVLMILMFGLGGLFMLVIPMPAPPGAAAADATVMTAVRVGMALFSAVIVALGIWWIVFFTRPRVVQQFIPAPPPPRPGDMHADALPVANTSGPKRPLSVTVVACFILLGAAFMPVGLFLHWPAVLFTKILTGWASTVYYSLFEVIALYTGSGLLRLDPVARLVCIATLAFHAINTAVFHLAPGGQERFSAMMAYSRTMFPGMPQNDQADVIFKSTPFLVMGGTMGLVIAAVTIYFLVAAKPAFEKRVS